MCPNDPLSSVGPIVKERLLAFPGKVLVKEGDWVEPSAIIAKSDYTRHSARVVNVEADLKKKILPEVFDQVVMVKPGDQVTVNQPLLKLDGVETMPCPCNGVVDHLSRLRSRIVIREDASSMKPMEVVRVAEIMNLHPRWLRANTLVSEGDSVVEGQMLAGISDAHISQMAYSPIAGVVTRVCPKTGTISVVRPMTSAKVHSYISGQVVKVVDDLGAIIKGYGRTIHGCFGTNGKAWGQLVSFRDDPQYVLTEADIDESVAGKIVLSGAMVTYEALIKARSLGARGLITGGINYRDILQFYHQSQDQPPFTVIILEGAGFMPPCRTIWKTLWECLGKTVSIDGSTVLGRERIRPEIIINEDTKDMAQTSSDAGVA